MQASQMPMSGEPSVTILKLRFAMPQVSHSNGCRATLWKFKLHHYRKSASLDDAVRINSELKTEPDGSPATVSERQRGALLGCPCGCAPKISLS